MEKDHLLGQRKKWSPSHTPAQPEVKMNALSCCLPSPAFIREGLGIFLAPLSSYKSFCNLQAYLFSPLLDYKLKC